MSTEQNPTEAPSDLDLMIATEAKHPTDISVLPTENGGRVMTMMVGLASFSLELSAEASTALAHALLPDGEAAFLRRVARTEFAPLKAKGNDDGQSVTG